MTPTAEQMGTEATLIWLPKGEKPGADSFDLNRPAGQRPGATPILWHSLHSILLSLTEIFNDVDEEAWIRLRDGTILTPREIIRLRNEARK